MRAWVTLVVHWFANRMVRINGEESGGEINYLSLLGVHKLYGIISWGQHCGFSNKPGVYVRISHYLDWIQEKLNHSMTNFGV